MSNKFSVDDFSALKGSFWHSFVMDCLENHRISLNERASLVNILADVNAAADEVESAIQTLYLGFFPILVSASLRVWPDCPEMDDFLMENSTKFMECLRKRNYGMKSLTAFCYSCPERTKDVMMGTYPVKACSVEDFKEADFVSAEGAYTDCVYAKICAEDMDKVLDTLRPNEKAVLRFYYGLDAVDETVAPHTSGNPSFSDIGRMLNLQSNRIQQIHNKALRRLRHPSRSKKLRRFGANIIG